MYLFVALLILFFYLPHGPSMRTSSPSHPIPSISSFSFTPSFPFYFLNPTYLMHPLNLRHPPTSPSTQFTQSLNYPQLPFSSILPLHLLYAAVACPPSPTQISAGAIAGIAVVIFGAIVLGLVVGILVAGLAYCINIWLKRLVYR